jgi:fructose-bisphosphate aldolase class II
VFVESPEQFDPRDYLKPARAAMQGLIATRMRDFGQAGHAGDYQPLSLEEMREGYAAAATAV